MKKGVQFLLCNLLLMLFLSGMTSSDVLATEPDGPKFEYKYEDNRIDLGTVYTDELEVFNLEIEFENTGNEPLVVSHVRGCCGTRIMEWTEEPLSPGEKGVIKVRFRLAARPHNVNRTVVAMSNDPDEQTVLRIRGRVADREEESFLQQLESEDDMTPYER